MEILARLERHGIRPSRLTTDSRRVVPGDVFLAYPGARVDGRDYIAQALNSGAVAVVAEAGDKAKVGAGDTPIVEVAGLESLSGEIAHLVYGRPSERLWVSGVTGTNGKTSVSQWIAQTLDLLGQRCAVVGTLGNGFVDALEPSPNTTPEAASLHASLANFLDRGAVAASMEVSSIGLDQGRVAGVAFDVAVLTNLTRDHLEYHGTMQAYAEAKARLFDRSGLRAAVLNLDDPFGAELARRLAGRLRTIGYSLGGAANEVDELLQAENLRMGASGIVFDLQGVEVSAPLVGRFNVANLLAVIAALIAKGERLGDVARVLPALKAPPGRFQVLGGIGQPLVVVDYAHTPDALEKALGVLRETATGRGGRLLCVFGCGGERDPGKRPQMGAVAEALADVVVLTSDNPRGEDPHQIAADIRAGMRAPHEFEVRREMAVARTVAAAAERDVILLAGKGHEPYQEIDGVRHPYSDLSAATAALEGRR